MSEKTQEIKSNLRVAINTMLIGMCFTVFTLIWALGPSVDFSDLILSQLAISIPLLFYSTASYSKLGYRKYPGAWNNFAVTSYLTAFSLIINSIGLMIYAVDLFEIAVIYFLLTWMLEFIYSAIDVAEDRANLRERVIKDAYLFALQFGLGLAVILIDKYF